MPRQGPHPRGVVRREEAATQRLERLKAARFNPFHLVVADAGGAFLWWYDGERTSLLDLSPEMKLMADLQYAFNRYRLYDEKYVETDFFVPYHFLNPRLGLNLNLDERWHLYVSGAYTSREPRLKNLYDAAESSTPESIS